MTATAQPFMKFYPQDWRADEKLRFCSLGARGLWIEMLALMHRSERYGQLLINGINPSAEQLAMQVAASAETVEEMLKELEAAGVFSRTATGSIYSRRMKRDEKKAKIARQNGKTGGNPNLRKQKRNPASDKGSDNREDKGGLKPHIPEARDQIPEEGSLNLGIPEESADAPNGAGSYAFEGRIIRLNAVDLARWKKTYHSIPDIEAELTAIDAWFVGDGAAKAAKWFHAAQGMLNRRHQENVKLAKQEPLGGRAPAGMPC